MKTFRSRYAAPDGDGALREVPRRVTRRTFDNTGRNALPNAHVVHHRLIRGHTPISGGDAISTADVTAPHRKQIDPSRRHRI